MKLLLISGSPRKEKSQTYQLAQELLKGHDSTVKSEIIHLCDLKINFCTACGICHKNILQCPIKDDVSSILKKMLAADGIILATPNYITHVTGLMKAFFDRSSHFIHCKRLLGKYTAGVVSSGSGRDEAVVDYLGIYSNVCGALYIGGVSARIPVDKEKKIEAGELGKSLVEAIKTKKAYPDQQEIIDSGKKYFKKVMEKRKDEWNGEYNYWKEKGWL